MTINAEYQVQAKYIGYIDLGAPAFAVQLSAIKPKSTFPGQVIFRSKVGDRFTFGETYAVTAQVSGDGQEFNVIGIN